MSAAEPAPAPALTPNPMAFGRLLRSEVQLIIGRRRNQMGLLVLAALPVVMAIAIRASNSRRGGPDFFSSVTSNGLFLSFAALGVEIALFLPLAIAMLAGDSIAGEANQGTLRYLLTVPVSRARLLLVKATSLAIGALIGVSVVAVAGLVAGIALFGTGPLTTLSGSQISVLEAFGRLALAVLYIAAGIAALGVVGLFISTLTEQPIAAMVALVIVTTLAWVLDAVPQVDWLHPWLIVDRWTAFSDVLRDPIYWSEMGRGLVLDAAYALVFGLLAWARFAGKDITS